MPTIELGAVNGWRQVIEPPTSRNSEEFGLSGSRKGTRLTPERAGPNSIAACVSIYRQIYAVQANGSLLNKTGWRKKSLSTVLRGRNESAFEARARAGRSDLARLLFHRSPEWLIQF